MNKISFSNPPTRRLWIILLSLALILGLILGSGGQAPSWAAPGQNSSQQTVPPRETETPEPPEPAPTQVPASPGDDDDEEEGSSPGARPGEAPAGANPGLGASPGLPSPPVEPEAPLDQPTEATGSEASDNQPQPLPNEAGDASEGGEGAEGAALQADLQLSLSTSHTRLQPAEILTFTLTLSNRGPATATGVRISQRLPVQLALTSALPRQGSYDFGTETWTVDSLSPDQPLTLHLVARTIGAGIMTTTAEIIAANQPDPDSVPGNGLDNEDDQASISVSVDPETSPASRAETVPGSTTGQVPQAWGEISTRASLLWLYALISGIILLISGLILVRRA